MKYFFILAFAICIGAFDTRAQNSSEPVQVIEHLRGASEVHFQEVDSLKFPEKFLSMKREPGSAVQRVRQEYLELDKRSIRVLPSCEQNASKQRRLNGNVSAQRYDLLVLAQTPPSNYKQLYGETVTAFRYDEDLKDGLSALMLDLGVTCLPTRIRSDGVSLSVETGKNALRNYSVIGTNQTKRTEGLREKNRK